MGIMSTSEPISAEQLRATISARMDFLRPLVEEHRQLEAAANALGDLEPPTVVSEPDTEAPYGRKVNGEPRRRPGRRRAPAKPSKGKVSE